MKNKEKYLTNFSEAKRKKATQKYNIIKPFILGEQSLSSISKKDLRALEGLDIKLSKSPLLLSNNSSLDTVTLNLYSLNFSNFIEFPFLL